jgi:raffinose/stachyose/melibiose transport system substrate-binding protein
MTKSMQSVGRRWAVIGAGLSVAVLLAACSPGSKSNAPAASTGSVSTGIDASKKVTITVADGWGTTGSGAAFGQVIKNFEKKYPNVTVTRQTTDYGTYQQSINLKGASPNPPDVMMLETSGYGQGFYNFASAGLLLPLDKYAKAYGWDSRFGNDANLDVFRFDPTNHDQWGTGTLYGVPEQNAQIGVFYNKALLAKAGVTSVPTTFAGFEQSLAAAKAKGVTGIEESNTFIHTEMALWDAFAGSASDVNNWVYGASGSFADPANLEAARTIQDWQSKGYFEDGAVGTNDSDAAAAFLAGKAMYYVEGSWMSGGVEGSLKANGGWFAFPSSSPTSPVGGGLTTPLVISAKSKHPDVAAAFLDYFTGPQASTYLFQHGWGLPGAGVPASLATAGSPTAAIIESLAKVEGPSGAGTTPFLDWSNPQFTTQLPTELQKLAAGHQSPSSFVTGVQSIWKQFNDKRKS